MARLLIHSTAPMWYHSERRFQHRDMLGNSMRIYLSGPITGRTDEAIKSWREVAADKLSPFAEIIDPTLAPYDSEVAFRKHEGPPEALERLRHGLFIVRRNKNLIRSSDVVLANLLGCDSNASIGSIGEICWAHVFDKPIIIARETFGNVHDHAMLNAMASEIVFSLDDAFRVIKDLAAVKEIPARRA